MEIKIKNAIVLKPEFLQAIERLLQSRPMPAKTCIEVNTAIDEIVSHFNILKRAKRDVTLRYCSKDPEGKPVIDAKDNVVFPDKEATEACNKAFADLSEESLTIQITQPVTIYDDENIAPLDLRLLGRIVEVKERPKV